jgi:hypothetical protein
MRNGYLATRIAPICASLFMLGGCSSHYAGRLDQGGSNLDQGRSNLDQGGSNLDQDRSNLDQAGAPLDQGGVDEGADMTPTERFTATNYTIVTSSGTFSGGIADFNHDGHPDLAVFVFEPAGVQILLNKGDGTFTLGPVITAGFVANSINSAFATADLNGDGNADLVAGAAPNINVYLGAGDGTFGTPATYTYASANPYTFALGAFHAGGHIGLVVQGEGNPGEVLVGNGDGTFMTPQTTIPLPTIYFGSSDTPHFALGDLNGDGFLDVTEVIDAPANIASTLTTYLGDGAGKFTAAFSLSAMDASYFFYSQQALGDFDGDHNLDLAVSIHGRLNVFLGTGDGKFKAPVIYPSSPGGRLVAGDFDGDGKLDLASAGDSATSFPSILRGGGDGTFAPAVQIPGLGQCDAGLTLMGADLDGDGKTDLVCNGTNEVIVLLSRS